MGGDYLSFWQFFSRCFVPFLMEGKLPLKRMHREVCDVLEMAYLSQLGKKFVVINIAPRVGKTKMLEALQCWACAYFPDSHMINTSYSGQLAEASTRQVAEVLQSDWYRSLFPWVQFGSVLRGNEFTTSAGGHFYGTGVMGTLAGFGAGLKRPAGGMFQIDDAANPAEVLSHTEAEKLNFLFENTFLRRRNSSEFTPIVCVGQRLAKNDLSGYILTNYAEQTIHLKFPVMVDGVSQFPETISTEDALKTLELNPFSYWAQLQQDPVVLGGNLIKVDDFMHYTDDPSTIRWDKKIITCDTALKTGQQNDYSVVQCWGQLGPKAYLIDQVRGRWESPELVTNFTAFYQKHHREGSYVARVTVEDKAAGTGLGQTLRRAGIPVEAIERTKDKVTRVHEVLPYIVTHMVYLPPKSTPWMPAFLSECAQFSADGKAAHDDQIDSLCDGVWLSLGRPLSILDVLGGKKR
jgi:predicted phage terminase large subunit-like protein